MENLLRDLDITQKMEAIRKAIEDLDESILTIPLNTIEDLDEEQLNSVRDYVSSVSNVYTHNTALSQLSRTFSRIQMSIRIRTEKLQSMENVEKSAQRGYTIGSLHYIDRQDGIYAVDSIDSHHVTFKYCLPDRSTRWAKPKKFHLDGIDRRMQPLRTVGPFKVGSVVVRGEREYTVRGYLGYRMVIERSECSSVYQYEGLKEYTIVSKKDESTYRSIII
jgi:hypothetical protein